MPSGSFFAFWILLIAAALALPGLPRFARAQTGGVASAPSATTKLPAKTIQLDPFNSIQICAPVNVAILPAKPGNSYGNFSLAVESEQVVQEALAATVINGTLQIETVRDFITSYPVQLVIYLPSDGLQAVALSNSIGEVSVGTGFNLSSLKVYSAFATANINVLNITVGQLTIGSSGTGQVFVNGSIGSAVIAAGGTSSIRIAGVRNSAIVNLGGTAKVFLGVTSAATSISGVSTGVNSVTSNSGICNVTSVFLFGSPCLIQDPLQFTRIAPKWSCGVNATGSFTCPAGGLQAASSDSSVGTTLGSTVPSILLSSSPSQSAAKPAILLNAPSLSPTKPRTLSPTQIPIATIASGLAGSNVQVSPSGSIVSNIGADQPGGRTAVASGSGSQTAIAANLGSGRKMLQSSATSNLYNLLGSTGTTFSSIDASYTPGTFSSTSGPGSLACSFVNGVGNCLSGSSGTGSVTSNSQPGSNQITNSNFNIPTGLFNNPLGSGTATNSASSSSSVTGGGSPVNTASTAGPNSFSSACTTVNGVTTCKTSGGGGGGLASPTPGQIFSALSGPPPYGTTAVSVIGSDILQTAGCKLAAGATLNIFN